MKTNFLGILAVVLVFTMTVTGCDFFSDLFNNDTVTNDTVTSVTVTVANGKVSVAKGGTLQFFASVNGTNSPDQTVEWSIVETGLAVGTGINSGGILSAAATETKASLTVKAVSTADRAQSGTFTVAVGDPTVSIGADVFWGKTYEYGDYSKEITITFTLSAGNWKDLVDLPKFDVIQTWFTQSAIPSAFAGSYIWVTQCLDRTLRLQRINAHYESSPTPPPSGTFSYTVTLKTDKLAEMKSYTTITNDNLIAGKTSDTDTSWDEKRWTDISR